MVNIIFSVEKYNKNTIYNFFHHDNIMPTTTVQIMRTTLQLKKCTKRNNVKL